MRCGCTGWGEPAKKSFSPLAGIVWIVRTIQGGAYVCVYGGFSPLAGIVWIVRVCSIGNVGCYASSGFSPLAGIVWIVRQIKPSATGMTIKKFQSPGGDCLDCEDALFTSAKRKWGEFQSPGGDCLDCELAIIQPDVPSETFQSPGGDCLDCEG